MADGEGPGTEYEREVLAHLMRIVADEPPLSRNRNVEAYDDPAFAQAMRAYRQIVGVTAQLHDVAAAGEGATVTRGARATGVGTRTVRFSHQDIRREATFTDDEWPLLLRDPVVADLLSER